jgi:hypothetical protein
MTTSQKKINLDSVTAQAWFKAVTQVTDEINDTMIREYQKRNNPETDCTSFRILRARHQG